MSLMTATNNSSASAQLTDSGGQPLDQWVATLYQELRRIAHQRMRDERQGYGHLLQTTALVNEAYLRLRELRQIDWRDHRHFFSAAAGIMRRVLIDQARAGRSEKRGGEAVRITLDDDIASKNGHLDNGVDLIMLDTALHRLHEQDRTQAQIVELRYFTGLSIAETAHTLSLSPATVKRKWTLAQAWLYRELKALE